MLSTPLFHPSIAVSLCLFLHNLSMLLRVSEKVHFKVIKLLLHIKKQKMLTVEQHVLDANAGKQLS
jgi:hypothetical protein